MLGKRLTPRPTVKPTLTPRRPPQQYVDLLTKSEAEFQHYVEELERHPLFRRLLQDGVISTVRFRGKIPRRKYEEYMDTQLVEFLEQSGITQHEGWEKDLLAPSAPQRIKELAAKYGVPVGELGRYVRYMAYSSRDDFLRESWAPPLPSDAYADDSGFDPVDAVAGHDQVDLAGVIDITRTFVEQYDLTEHDFIENVLFGGLSPAQLATKYGCSIHEAERVLEAAEQVQIADSYEKQPVTQQQNAGHTHNADVIARIDRTDDGQMSIQFSTDSVYVQRYRIRVDALKEKLVKAQAADVEVEAARELVAQARFVNQRLSALSRLIAAVVEHQKAYILTGDPIDLKPLSQADLARQVGEHQSTICRVIRDKWVETPQGRLPLTFFCQTKTDVVVRLVEKYQDYTDKQIQDMLEDDYNCEIARRTVAYHRGKRLGPRIRRRSAEKRSGK